MPAASSPSVPTAVLSSALNALLDRQPASRSRLLRHQGKSLRIALPLLPLDLALDQEGRFRPAAADVEAALTLLPSPANLPLWLTGGSLAGLFRAEGDGVLAADIAGALAEFDWVLALRPYLGDMAASRVDQMIRGFEAWRRQALDGAGRNLAEYAVYEEQSLAQPEATREFIAGVDRLRGDADRLEARLKRLETRLPAKVPDQD
jgi:ubiquinone biosynthesis protein UbiJ